RHAKSKARLRAFEELSAEEFQKRAETREIYIPPGPRLGAQVFEVEGLKKSFGGRVLYEDVSFRLPPGGILGIIGANGRGKTTLLEMLTHRMEPDAGTIKVGETVQFAYAGQSRDELDNSKTVWQAVSDGNDILKIGNYEVPSRAYIGRFNFKGEQQQRRVDGLSGGERNRVHLARTLLAGGNVLLLDEPTNDLDTETLRALEEAILDFPGSAVVVSHDRWFLDRVATHILAFEDSGEVTFMEGNYQDYEADFRRRTGADPGVNRRGRHKKLA
ncbi:MAG: ATP-binding cassette domain-containing protein, partial [Sinobacteraceae bacterium]|nr:ATP-binding cassette domain-containing protein [Nevskiaceae bacterium]